MPRPPFSGPGQPHLNPNPQWPFWVGQPPPAQVVAGPVNNQVSFTAALTFTGSQQRAIGKFLTAVLSFTGAQARQIGKLLAAGLSFSGAQARAITKGLAASLTFSGALRKAVTKGLTAVLSFTGALTKQTGKLLAATLTFTGAMSRLPGKSLTATLTFTGAQSKAVGKSLAATLTFTGALKKAITKGLTATLTFTGSLTKAVTKTLTAAVLTFTGALARLPGKSFTATLTFTGKQSRALGKNLPAALTFTGSQAKAVTQHLTAALSFTGKTLKAVGKKLAGAVLTFVGNLSTIHSGPSTTPPPVCYPTTALFVPYASAPNIASYASTLTVASHSTTTTIPAHDTTSSIANTPPAYGAMVFTAGVASYYRLDDTTTTAADQLNAVNGTYSGTYSQSQPGALINDPDTAATFSAGKITLASNPLAVGSVSLEVWFKTSGATGTIFDMRPAVGANRAVVIRFVSNVLSVFFGNGTTNPSVTPSGTWNDGNWHHLVATYDGTTIRVYMDGQANGTAALAGPISYGTTPTPLIATDATPRNFAGTLDEFAFYNNALSAATVSQHYALGRTPATTNPTATAIASHDTKTIVPPHDTTNGLVGYQSGVTHFNTCND